MLIKLLIAAGVAVTAVAGTFYALNKTAESLEKENNEMPEDQRATQEQLDSVLHAAFIDRAQQYFIVRLLIAAFTSVSGMMQEWMDHRVKVALVGIILAAIPGLSVPLLAVKACWGILAIELIYRTAVKSLETTAGQPLEEQPA